MKIIYKSDYPRNFVKNISQQINVPIIDGRIEIPESLGRGFIQQVTFSDNFSVFFYEIIPRFSITVIKEKSENTHIFPITFWISENEFSQITNNETKSIGLNSPFGIFLPSSQIYTEMYFPANEKISNISIILSKNWFQQNIPNNYKNNTIEELVKQKSPFFLFEDITLEMRTIIRQITNFQSQNDYSSLYLQGKAFELLSIFFTKVNKRKTTITNKNISSNDVTTLFEARKHLITNFKKTPSLKDVFLKSGMCESKFQALFKQMFGMSAYQYHITAKMEEAKKLLLSNTSVSEVGFMLGYSNLSHFTEIFRKHFNITPGKFVKQSISK